MEEEVEACPVFYLHISFGLYGPREALDTTGCRGALDTTRFMLFAMRELWQQQEQILAMDTTGCPAYQRAASVAAGVLATH